MAASIDMTLESSSVPGEVALCDSLRSMALSRAVESDVTMTARYAI